MNSFYKKLFIVLLILLVFGILVVFVFDMNCIIKDIFHIACPGCGLTRGFKALFNLDIKGAFYYNVLTIPIFLFLICLIVLILTDLIKKKNYVEKYLIFFVKHYYLIIILLILSMIINNIKGI